FKDFNRFSWHQTLQLKFPLGEVCGYTSKKSPQNCDGCKSEEPSIGVIAKESHYQAYECHGEKQVCCPQQQSPEPGKRSRDLQGLDLLLNFGLEHLEARLYELLEFRLHLRHDLAQAATIVRIAMHDHVTSISLPLFPS